MILSKAEDDNRIELTEYEGLITSSNDKVAYNATQNTVPYESGYKGCTLQIIIILLAFVSFCVGRMMRDTDNIDGNMKNTTILPRINRWPNPTIVVGMPKSGTSTIAEYFECGNNLKEASLKVSHWRCMGGRTCGLIIRQNMIDDSNADPLRNTGDFDVYAQLDIDGNRKSHNTCYFPQIEILEDIHAHHPNSTFILNLRNITNWIKSVKRWNNMLFRLEHCGIINSSSISIDQELTRFYNEQIKRVRDFVKEKDDIRLVEVTIDSPSAGKTMEDEFGISEQCWGHANQNHIDYLELFILIILFLLTINTLVYYRSKLFEY